LTGLHLPQEIPEQLPDAELPLGIPFMRWFFGASQGLQITLVAIGVVLALAMLAWEISCRRPIARWLRSRNRIIQVTLATMAVALLVSVVGAGRGGWNYMQHDNDFCTGCHVMSGAFERFTQSGHAELSCHDCHQQSIFASMRQLREWVRDRPEEIGEHSPVPNTICADCHIDDDPRENWFQIASTAGHIAHLESDSSTLAGLQCVTCHGQEVHQFLPADQTCAQANCHAEESTRIVLGAMTRETGLHCVTCHEFTAERVAPTRVDSATGPLTPGLTQCTSCHEMEALWVDYDPWLDPHDAKCGACHNPHEQDLPELALTSCTSAGCHARPDTLSTLHIGIAEDKEDDCTGCHQPHVWVRDGDDCASCHTDIPTSVALAPRVRSPLAGRSAPPAGPVAASMAPVGSAIFRHLGGAVAEPVRQQGGFTHAAHRTVRCNGCHSNSRRHGEVTVRTQSDCFSCHHATRTASAQGCGQCHTPRDLGQVQVTSTVRLGVWAAGRVRSLPFRHDAHTDLRCIDCHGGGTRQRVQTACADCHEDHHPPSGDTQCASCHEQHREDAHTARVHTEGCTGAGCHIEPRFSRMERTREFCASCHQDMIDHEPREACLTCHLVPPPGSGRDLDP